MLPLHTVHGAFGVDVAPLHDSIFTIEHMGGHFPICIIKLNVHNFLDIIIIQQLYSVWLEGSRGERKGEKEKDHFKCFLFSSIFWIK